MKALDLATGILYIVVALIEVLSVVIALRQSIRLARMFYVLAPLGVIVTIAVQVIAVVIHFVAKGNLVHRCIFDTRGQATTDDAGNASTINIEQASNICFATWSRATSTVIIWLIIALVVSLLFASIALSYYRQLLDPNSVRRRNTVPQQQQQAFQMQAGIYPPPPDNRQSWMVPPYPGSANTPPPNFEKSDYQPEAEWANVEPIAYAPPSGPPPRNAFTDVSGSGPNVAPNRAEDEAWERARSEGVTAHLTGHAPPPAVESQGYVIGNPEEDEAWERARTEGVTAHLTGADIGGHGRV